MDKSYIFCCFIGICVPLIMIYKTLLRKIKMSNTNPTKKTGVHSRAPEELAVPVPLVAPFVLLLKHTNIILHGNHVGH